MPSKFLNICRNCILFPSQLYIHITWSLQNHTVQKHTKNVYDTYSMSCPTQVPIKRKGEAKERRAPAKADVLAAKKLCQGYEPLGSTCPEFWVWRFRHLTHEDLTQSQLQIVKAICRKMHQIVCPKQGNYLAPCWHLPRSNSPDQCSTRTRHAWCFTSHSPSGMLKCSNRFKVFTFFPQIPLNFCKGSNNHLTFHLSSYTQHHTTPRDMYCPSSLLL